MHFKFSIGESRTEDSALAFVLTRMEPGAGKNDLEIQFEIHCCGEIERHALPAESIRESGQIVAIRITRQRVVDYFIRFKTLLHVHESDVLFMGDIASGMTGMFAVDPTLMADTTYMLTVTTEIATANGWEGLPRAPYPLESDVILGSVTVPEGTLEDLEDNA
jgi:hypothetical protein